MGRRKVDGWRFHFLVWLVPVLLAILSSVVAAFYFDDRAALESDIASLGQRAGTVETNVGFLLRDVAVLTALSEAERDWNRAQVRVMQEVLREIQRRVGERTSAAP